MDEHEYVEYVLDVEDGKIVCCEYAGEGRQATPLTEQVTILFYPPPNEPFPRGWKRLERRIKRTFDRLCG